MSGVSCLKIGFGISDIKMSDAESPCRNERNTSVAIAFALSNQTPSTSSYCILYELSKTITTSVFARTAASGNPSVRNGLANANAMRATINIRKRRISSCFSCSRRTF